MNGVCVALCGGVPQEPECPGSTRCVAGGKDQFYGLCREVCDPLASTCDGDTACHAADPTCPECVPLSAAGTFACIPVSGSAGKYQDPCGASQQLCDPGYHCAEQPSVPDCGSSDGCCTAYCDLSSPDCPAGTT